MSNPFDNLKITRQEAIDRLAKAQLVLATFWGGLRGAVTAIVGDEVFTHTSVRPLGDVVFFSSENEEFDDEDVAFFGSEDDEFDDGDLETTIF